MNNKWLGIRLGNLIYSISSFLNHAFTEILPFSSVRSARASLLIPGTLISTVRGLMRRAFPSSYAGGLGPFLESSSLKALKAEDFTEAGSRSAANVSRIPEPVTAASQPPTKFSPACRTSQGIHSSRGHHPGGRLPTLLRRSQSVTA